MNPAPAPTSTKTVTITIQGEESDPSVDSRAIRHLKADDYFYALWEIDQMLRSEYKYNGKEEAYDLRVKMGEILASKGINFDYEQ
jgi:hypothetical protein